MTTPKLPVMSMAVLISFTSVSHAEVNLDGTLGPKIDLPGPHFQIEDHLGQQHGANLFHSFEAFSINRGESATFTGPNSVENVISRVTGGKESLIDGTLASKIPNANLYLLNPRGILFGKEASLDLNGSFHASTADYLQFEDGNRFYAKPSETSLLSIAPLSSFGFLNKPQGNITLKGSHLQVENEKTLSLIGGDLSLVDGSELFAPDGKINLISAASPGDVVPGVSNSAENWGNIQLSHFLEMADNKVKEYKMAHLNTNGTHGGEIFIQGGNFVSKGSYLTSKVVKDDSSVVQTNPQHGKITLLAQDGIELTGSNIDTTGSRAGEIFIEGGHFVSKGSYLTSKVVKDDSSVAQTNSQPGKITLLAQDRIELTASNIAVDAEEGTSQDAGDILIETRTMALNPSCPTCGISSDTSGKGNSGDITITASEDLTITRTGISVVSGKGETGNAGNIHLTVGQLTLQNGGFINSGTLGSGDGGDIEIKSREGVLLAQGSLISSSVGEKEIGASGNGGNIDINAPRLEITDSSGVQTGAFSLSTGYAGDIQINVDQLVLENLSTIIASNVGQKQSGNIFISSHDSKLKQSSIFSFNRDQNEAGSIRMTTDNLLLDNSVITALGVQGNGGEIELQVSNELRLEDSFILTRVYGSKEAPGDIDLDVQRFMIDNGLLLTMGRIGDGGNINIDTDHFTILGDSRIDVSSKHGVNGQFLVNSVQIEDELLASPPTELLESGLSLDQCAGLTPDNSSSFHIITRDGLMQEPGDLQTSLYLPEDDENILVQGTDYKSLY
jgi:filamentous hemagglutinin family protein